MSTTAGCRPVNASRSWSAELAATPGAVVYRDEVCEVIQYAPTTPSAGPAGGHDGPPQINKYYFMDLAPGRSFVEHAVCRGLQFFVISWRNPGTASSATGISTPTPRRVLRAIDVVREITRSDDVNLLGLCAGGILTTTVLSHLAATGDERVDSASFGVTLLDFEVPAPIGMFDAPPVAVAGAVQARAEPGCSTAERSGRCSPGCGPTTWCGTTGSTTT